MGPTSKTSFFLSFFTEDKTHDRVGVCGGSVWRTRHCAWNLVFISTYIRLFTCIIEITHPIFQNIREFIQKKNSKPEVIYTSEDIQKKREEEFQFKMREQENNMKSILNPPKPKEVRFADDNEEDKPIGENMDALVSEMLAKREKQLEDQLSLSKK